MNQAEEAFELRESGEARTAGVLHLSGARLVVFEESPQMSGKLQGELTRFVLEGKGYVLARHLPRSGEKRPVDILTARELQIAALVAAGLINKEVASRLGISEWTVCTHLRRIYSKLRVSTRGAMVFRCADLVGTASEP
jgi:DNA-binding CsgD family transcriptional regulator